MNWDYIAGFFDGEGYVRIDEKRNNHHLTFANTNRQVLENIKEFLGCGQIYEKHVRQNRKPAFDLYISNHLDVTRIAKQLVNRTIVKKEKLTTVLHTIEKHDWSNSPGKLKITKEELGELYWTQAKSLSEIAKMLGVHGQSVRQKMIRFGIKLRSRRDAYRLWYLKYYYEVTL